MNKIILLILSLILVGCEKTIDESELVEREDIQYQINSDKPYTGSVFSYHDNGQVKTSGMYKKGLKGGLFEEFYENGQLLSSVNYFMGGKEGVENIYFENSSIRFRNTYKNNVLNGVRETYFDTGELKTKEDYLNGEFKKLFVRYVLSGKEVLYVRMNNKGEFMDNSDLFTNGTTPFDRPVLKGSGEVYEGPYIFEYYHDGNLGGSMEFEHYDSEKKLFKVYYDNGQLSESGTVKGMELHGVVDRYSEDGTKVSSTCNQNGKEVNMSFCEVEKNSE